MRILNWDRDRAAERRGGTPGGNRNEDRNPSEVRAFWRVPRCRSASSARSRRAGAERQVRKRCADSRPALHHRHLAPAGRAHRERQRAREARRQKREGGLCGRRRTWSWVPANLLAVTFSNHRLTVTTEVTIA